MNKFWEMGSPPLKTETTVVEHVEIDEEKLEAFLDEEIGHALREYFRDETHFEVLPTKNGPALHFVFSTMHFGLDKSVLLADLNAAAAKWQVAPDGELDYDEFSFDGEFGVRYDDDEPKPPVVKPSKRMPLMMEASGHVVGVVSRPTETDWPLVVKLLRSLADTIDERLADVPGAA